MCYVLANETYIEMLNGVFGKMPSKRGTKPPLFLLPPAENVDAMDQEPLSQEMKWSVGTMHDGAEK
jgi:hypothetical protein